MERFDAKALINLHRFSLGKIGPCLITAGRLKSKSHGYTVHSWREIVEKTVMGEPKKGIAWQRLYAENRRKPPNSSKQLRAASKKEGICRLQYGILAPAQYAVKSSRITGEQILCKNKRPFKGDT